MGHADEATFESFVAATGNQTFRTALLLCGDWPRTSATVAHPLPCTPNAPAGARTRVDGARAHGLLRD